MNNILTDKAKENLRGYPLYSQDGKGVEASVRAIYEILGLGMRWYVLEANLESKEFFTLFRSGSGEYEYGYTSIAELEELPYPVHFYEDFEPTKLKDIEGKALQEFLKSIHRDKQEEKE